MNELDLPLRSPALYNPHLLSRDELLALFAAREDLLSELVSDLRATPLEEPAQHHLVIGQRGMGKTMLLRRLQVAIEDDPELGETWLPLSFPEEQYNVVTLSDFWLNCVDALSDRLEAGERFPDAVEALDRAVEEIRNVQDETHRAERALDALVGTAESLGRRLLLLVDNADLILDRIGEQDWSLREVLSSRPKVTFIGASAAMLESTYEYGRAFYDFFKVHELAGLSVEETKRFLLRYAEAQDNAHVRQVVEAEPARLRVLHTLTGGNPRTLVLLFNIFAHGAEGDVRADLEQLLDQCTPLYKARFEALPAQAQQVVDALALHWDPVSAGELAEIVRMKVNQVSAQLNRLHQIGLVEKVPYEPESKTGFQIAERFFNIWYLMRASRRVRRRLVWLVEFLRVFYGDDQLRVQIKRYLREVGSLSAAEVLRRMDYGFALAAASGGELGSILELGLLHSAAGHDELAERLDDLIPKEDRGSALQTRAEYLSRVERLKIALQKVPSEQLAEIGITSRDSFAQMALPIGLKQGAVLSLRKGDSKHVELRETYRPFIGNFLKMQQDLLDQISTWPDAPPLEEALKKKWMLSLDDVVGAQLAEEAIENENFVPVAVLFRRILSADSETVGLLEERLAEAKSPLTFWCWLRLWGAEPTTRIARGFVQVVEQFVAEQSKEQTPALTTAKALDKLQMVLYALSGLAVLEAWEEAWESARMLLDLWNRESPNSFYPPIVVFFQQAVAAGHPREAADLLDALDLGERWRPLREALEAIARDSDTYLRRVAPEVREPAEAILKELREPIETS